MRVACIGNAVYDFTVSGCEFIVEGERNSFIDADYSAGGPASNAASVISRFGTNVDFYGRVGNDVTGKFVYDKMVADKVNVGHVCVSNELMTPFSFVMINESNNTRTICTVRSKADYINPEIGNVTYETGYDYILTDGKYISDTHKLIDANPQAKTVIDAGRVSKEILELCKRIDYIICSQDFAENVTKCKINDDYNNNVMVFNKLKAMYPKANLTITVGEKGYICEKDGIVMVNPPYKSGLPVVDTNCAGDIFHGAFTYAIANDYDYYQALEFANTTASLSISKSGGRDSCPSLEEVEVALNGKSKCLSKRIENAI